MSYFSCSHLGKTDSMICIHEDTGAWSLKKFSSRAYQRADKLAKLTGMTDAELIRSTARAGYNEARQYFIDNSA